MGKTQSKKHRSYPQIGRHFRLENRASEGTRRPTEYQRRKWLRRYWAYRRAKLWKETRNK